jgi:hypothetical protein
VRAGLGWLILVLLCAPAAAAQEANYPAGASKLDTDLVVAANETLHIGPGTSILGSGRIVVHGALDVEGSPTSRVEISVPILLDGNGSSRFVDAHLWGVNGTALTLRAGNLTLERVAFEGDDVGLDASGGGTLEARDVLFRAERVASATVAGLSSASFVNATFEDGGLGVALDAASNATALVAECDFERNLQHATVHLGAGPSTVRFERDRFGPAASTSAPGTAALTLSGPPADGAPRVVSLANDTFLQNDVSLRVSGQGFSVDSAHDVFLGSRIGVALDAANVALRNDTFQTSVRDVDGAASSIVLTEGDSFTPPVGGAIPAAAARDAAGGVPGWAFPAVLAVGATVGAVALLRRRRPAAPSLEGPPAAEPPAATAPDLATPLRPLERRILEDLVANPGSAQSAVAARLGLSRQALHYHVKKLEARSLLRKEARGRETRCFAAAGVAEALTPEATDTVQLESQQKP